VVVVVGGFVVVVVGAAVVVVTGFVVVVVVGALVVVVGGFVVAGGVVAPVAATTLSDTDALAVCPLSSVTTTLTL
jgi:hypothetical protein